MIATWGAPLDRRRGIPPFVTFLEEHRAMVHRFLIAAVGPGEADDCFQETFLAALRAYPRVRRADRLDRWVLRIAARKAIDAHRARNRRPVPTAELDAVAERIPAHPDPRPDPGDPVWDAVRVLPPKQRAAVVLRHVLDRPYVDVAAALGCSEEAARANVYEGLKRLREAAT